MESFSLAVIKQAISSGQGRPTLSCWIAKQNINQYRNCLILPTSRNSYVVRLPRRTLKPDDIT